MIVAVLGDPAATETARADVYALIDRVLDAARRGDCPLAVSTLLEVSYNVGRLQDPTLSQSYMRSVEEVFRACRLLRKAGRVA
jgi:hypothetical protein